MLYQHEMQSRRDESRPDWAAMAAAEWERALSLCTSHSRGCRILCLALTCTFEARDLGKASLLAQKLLDESYEPWAAEEARHFGHQLLGRIALERGDVERAKAHLFESIATSRSVYLLAIGPRMRLAKELLHRGETEVVLKYLRQCSNPSVRARRFARWPIRSSAARCPISAVSREEQRADRPGGAEVTLLGSKTTLPSTIVTALASRAVPWV